MKWKYILSGALATVCIFSVQARGKIDDHVIYKWTENGLIYYSYIQPENNSQVKKLNSTGMEIKDYNPNRFEIIKPLTNDDVASAQNQGKATPSEEEAKLKNCNIAKENLENLTKNIVYKKDPQGNFVRLEAAEIATKKEKSQRDVDYFCSP